MESKRPIAYVAISADLLHPGHLNVIGKAAELGDVVIGLMTDRAMSVFSRLPYMTYEQRKIVVESVKGVVRVMSQDTPDYTANLESLRPEYVVHGDDWREGPQKEIRRNVVETLRRWNGKLVEVPYTYGITSNLLKNVMRNIGGVPEIRRLMLGRLLRSRDIVRVIEAHSGLSSMIAENTVVRTEEGHRAFDAIWISSLTQSAVQAKPDNGYLDTSSRLALVNQILEATNKPVIFDGDSGGPPEHFVFTVKALERIGVSAVIIEDKVGTKRNSLFGMETEQLQDDPHLFAEKIRIGRKVRISDDFMIFARIESLVLGKSVDDAMRRAEIYLDAGADGIMIHSSSPDFGEIGEFSGRYNRLPNRKPLVVVPTSYDYITERELIDNGVNVVIYANHLLRASYPAMVTAAESILRHGRAKEASKSCCMSIRDIITLIPDAVPQRQPECTPLAGEQGGI